MIQQKHSSPWAATVAGRSGTIAWRCGTLPWRWGTVTSQALHLVLHTIKYNLSVSLHICHLFCQIFLLILLIFIQHILSCTLFNSLCWGKSLMHNLAWFTHELKLLYTLQLHRHKPSSSFIFFRSSSPTSEMRGLGLSGVCCFTSISKYFCLSLKERCSGLSLPKEGGVWERVSEREIRTFKIQIIYKVRFTCNQILHASGMQEQLPWCSEIKTMSKNLYKSTKYFLTHHHDDAVIA